MLDLVVTLVLYKMIVVCIRMRRTLITMHYIQPITHLDSTISNTLVPMLLLLLLLLLLMMSIRYFLSLKGT